jgi:hypothetical protein
VNKTRSRNFLASRTSTGPEWQAIEPPHNHDTYIPSTPYPIPLYDMVTAHTSIYSMLMTVLFYTTASLCTLRTAAWLSTHAILPALSRIVSYCYIDYYYYTNSGDHIRSSSSPPSLAGLAGRQASDAGTGTRTGTLFKLVRTAAGHILFVPVSVAGPGEESPVESFSLWMTRNAIRCFWLTLVGIVLITSYPYYIKAVSTVKVDNGRMLSRTHLPPFLSSLFVSSDMAICHFTNDIGDE